MEKTSNRLYHWDNVKFILILLVVIGHFLGVYEDEYVILKKLFYCITIFHMPLFVFVTGMFSKSTINGKHFRVERIFYYGVLYLLLKMMIFGCSMLFHGTKKIQLLTDQGIAWYLVAVILWLCVTRVFRYVRPEFMIALAFLTSLCVGYDWRIGTFFSLSRFFVFYPFFLLGYYLNPEKVTGKLNQTWMKAAAVLVFLAVGYVCYFHLKEISWIRPLMVGSHSYEEIVRPKAGALYRSIYYLIAAVVSAAAVILVPKGKTFFSEWGSKTLTVYFWHRPILTLMVQFGLKKFLENVMPGSWLIWYLLSAGFLTLILLLPVFDLPLVWLKKQCDTINGRKEGKEC